MTKILRRARRIAADEAHAWARNLRLGNLHAKLVLSMLTLYVDAEGCSFVSIPSLAEDCEMSIDTVRRRLVWLEKIGAIARIPQWLDENGNRSSAGRGKRTTDLIRLLTDGDPATIEGRASGDLTDDEDEIAVAFSPSSQQGLNSPSDSVSPRPAIGQPSHCGEGLNSEPEPESPLKSPPGTKESEQIEDSEPEDFAAAWQAWRGHEVMRRDLALSEFRLLSIEKQQLCRAAIGHYNALLDKYKRETVVNFHIWIRQKGFEEFPNAKLAVPLVAVTKVFIPEEDLAALRIAFQIAGARLILARHEDRAGVWRNGPLPNDLLALASSELGDPSDWQAVAKGSEQFGAWRDRLRAWTGFDAAEQNLWQEPHDPAVHGLPYTNPHHRFRKKIEGIRVPWPWPPSKDGKVYSDEAAKEE